MDGGKDKSPMVCEGALETSSFSVAERRGNKTSGKGNRTAKQRGKNQHKSKPARLVRKQAKGAVWGQTNETHNFSSVNHRQYSLASRLKTGLS